MSKFCGNCGAPMTEAEKFCGHCGWRLEGNGGFNTAMNSPIDGVQQVLEERDVEKKGTSKNFKLGILAIILAIVSVAGYYGYNHMQEQAVIAAQEKMEAAAKEEAETKAKEEAENKAKAEAEEKKKQEEAVDSAKKALADYHQYISSSNLISAYNMYSTTRKSQVGSYDSWAYGYSTTISSTLVDAKPTHVSENRVVFDYKLNARDALNGRIKLQTFIGTVTMIKVDNRWLMDDMTGVLQGSSYE